MKVAISIPEPLFEAAEAAADRLAVSRSELYRRAIESFLLSDSAGSLTEQINRVCEKVDTSVDPDMLEMAQRSLPPDDWGSEPW